jgi:TPP-dependent pyruvate/acetoin dehydrogenase alpha subunit
LHKVSQDEAREASTEIAVSGENPLLGSETLKRIYKYMVQCRAFAQSTAREKRNSSYGGPAAGLEAVEVATMVHLRPGDTIALDGARWISSRLPDGPLAQMMTDLFPEQGGQAVLNVISDESKGAAQAGIATGLALGYKRHQADGVVLALSDRTSLGDAASSEAMAFAGNRKLPIVYMVENNLWEGLNSLGGCGSDDELRVRALNYGFPAIPVDGNDAIAVYRVTQEAIARARKNGGPTLIECKTFRWFGHPKVDPAKLRPATEVAQWKVKDPIVHMETYLKKKGLWLE